jgi:hypothetical protein
VPLVNARYTEWVKVEATISVRNAGKAAARINPHTSAFGNFEYYSALPIRYRMRLAGHPSGKQSRSPTVSFFVRIPSM